MKKQIVKLEESKLLKLELLGTDVCTEVYEMRANGSTYQEIIEFLKNDYNYVCTTDQLIRFFRKYNVLKSESNLHNDYVKNQILRKKQMERRIDMVSNILENQLIEVNDSSLKPDQKAAVIADLCKVMLETIHSDVLSQGEKTKVTQNSTNVQVNIGDQLKEVAKQKAGLKKEILTANFDMKDFKPLENKNEVKPVMVVEEKESNDKEINIDVVESNSDFGDEKSE